MSIAMRTILLTGLLIAISWGELCGGEVFSGGWSAEAPREEIRPAFSFEKEGGPKRGGSLVIRHDSREGLDGWFQKTFAVTGGEYRQFRVLRKVERVAVPRRSALVRIVWQNDAGEKVSAEVPEAQVQSLGHIPSAEPEHPADGSTDAMGWTVVSGVYAVPPKATRAVVELHLQWAPGGSVEWSEVVLTPSEKPASRKVRLATVHYRPSGKSPRENCEEYGALIAKAAKQKADLVVLGETVPYVNVKKKPHETAETIPGSTTECFGAMAKKHGLHLVVSLYERAGALVYNTAVLIGPEGEIIGKYRKICLPHGEVDQGIAPGDAYPVFETKFGKVGMMVCYDGFYPEVARQLSNRGAEVIAWPVWGCNPRLAVARACENHVYVVSSTYTDAKANWMVSAVYDPTGTPLVEAKEWGSVAVVEVDLSRPYVGPWNLGDFRAMIERHRPVEVGEGSERVESRK